jgi:hypothetical protein
MGYQVLGEKMQSMLGNDTEGNHQIEQGVEIEELEGQLKQGQNGKGVDGDKGSVRPKGGGGGARHLHDNL